MKQYTIFTGLALLMAGFACMPTASAETLSSDSVVCISKNLMKKYQGHLLKNETEFAADMRDRAQCVVNQRPYDVSVLETSGDYSKVEVLGGTKIWVVSAELTSDIAETAAE